MSEELREKAELLPCPFCGGEAAIEQTGRQELTLRCVGVQPSGLKGCGPKFVQKVKAHSLEWLSGKMAERWNRRAALSPALNAKPAPAGEGEANG